MYYVYLLLVSGIAVLTGCFSTQQYAQRNALFVLLFVIAAACIDTARTLKQHAKKPE